MIHEFYVTMQNDVGKDIKLGSKGDGDEIKLAQESLELVRLRLEQVGFSNKAVWGGSIKDANVADSLVRKNRVALIAAAGAKGTDFEILHEGIGEKFP